MAEPTFQWTGGYDPSAASHSALGQSGVTPPSKGLTIFTPKKADPASITTMKRSETQLKPVVSTVQKGKDITGDTGDVIALKFHNEIMGREMDPRYNSLLMPPQHARESVRPAGPALERLWGRLQALMQKKENDTGDLVSSYLEEHGKFLTNRLEDVKITMGNYIKNIGGVDKANTGEAEKLAREFSAAGMHKEAQQIMQDESDRAIDDMTDRELEDSIKDPSKGEKLMRSLTQGATEGAIAVFGAKGLGAGAMVEGKIGSQAMKGFMAQQAVESTVFTMSKFDFKNTPIQQLPQEFFTDLAIALPATAGIHMGSAQLMNAAGAFRSLLTGARKSGVELSPKSIREGMSGVPNEDFAVAWNSLAKDEQETIQSLWQQQRVIGESRPIFKRDPNLNPEMQQPKFGEGIPKAPPQRAIPRGDVPQVFRADKLDLPKADELRVLAHIDALGFNTRGVQTFEQVKEIADTLGMDPVALVNGIKNNHLVAAEVLALRDTLNTSARYLTHANELLEQTLKPAEREAIETSIKKHEYLINDAVSKLIKGGTQAGRTVNAYRLIARNTMDPAYWIKEAKRVLPEGKILTDEHFIAINDLIRKKDSLGLAHFVAKLRETSTFEKAVTLWKAGLLTSPTTHMANFMGNTTMQALETVSDVPATMIDWAISKVSKSGARTKVLTPRGFAEQGKGLLVTGPKKASTYFTTGIDSDNYLSKYDIPRTTNYNNAYLQMYTDTVFRTLGATDKIFREGVMRKSLYEQAVLKVKNMKPQELKDVLSDLEQVYGGSVTRKDAIEFFFKNSSDDAAAIAINASEEESLRVLNREYISAAQKSAVGAGKAASDYATFQQNNWISSAISGAKARSGVGRVALEIVLPFSKTPTNIAFTMADYSPVGFLKSVLQGLKGNQRGFVDSFGRAITGTSIMALGAKLAELNLLTSTLPTSKAEREMWIANGITQQSIFVNGKWRRLDRLSPFGNLLVAGGEFNRMGKERTMADRYSQTAFGGLKGLTEQSFLSGLSQAIDAVKDPEAYGMKYVQNAIASVVPTLIARIAQGVDPKIRDPQTILEALASRVPILSQTVPVKKNVFGQDRENNKGLGSRLLDPFDSSTPTGDIVAGELFRLNEAISLPAKGMYNNQEYRQLLEMRGMGTIDGQPVGTDANSMMYPLLYSIMKSPQWDFMTDDVKRYNISGVSAGATQAANAFMKQKAAIRIAKELQRLSPGDRDIRFNEISDKDKVMASFIQKLFSTQPEFDR